MDQSRRERKRKAEQLRFGTARREYGEAGIRTRDTSLTPYNGLANRRLQPLGHLSGESVRLRVRIMPNSPRLVQTSRLAGFLLFLHPCFLPLGLTCFRIADYPTDVQVRAYSIYVISAASAFVAPRSRNGSA
jgi:hypothetical protein